MNRLVYSPKAYAFVRTQDNPDGLDLSDFIVSGSVTRVINEVSTAQITIRNPIDPDRGTKGATKYGRFTLDLDDADSPAGRPTFHPMDPITIFLARYTDKPVQVFTGYLDTAPYIQLFPGTITLQASCTLKRLLYTYWDPALPFTEAYLHQFGWEPNYEGSLTNIQQLGKQLDPNDPKLTDSGFGDLLYHILKDIGAWTDDEIYIENLPDTIVSTVGSVYGAIASDNAAAEKDLTSLLSKIIGTASQGSAGVSTTGSIGSSGHIDIAAVQKFNHRYPKGVTLTQLEVRAINEAVGFDPGRAVQFMHIAEHESTLEPGIFNIYPGDGGVGLYQLTPHAWGSNSPYLALMAKYGGYANMTNPVANAAVAYGMYKISGFGPWAPDIPLAGPYNPNTPSVLNRGQRNNAAQAVTQVARSKGVKTPGGGEVAATKAGYKSAGTPIGIAAAGVTQKPAKKGPGGYSGYVYPLPQAHTITSLDRGIDFSMAVGAPILAIGNAVIDFIGPWGGAAGTQPYLLYHLLDGPNKGAYIYVAEQIAPTVHQGQHVVAGQVIARYASSGTAIEMGWGTSQPLTVLAAQNGHADVHGTVSNPGTPESASFYKFLQGLPNTGPVAAGASVAAGSQGVSGNAGSVIADTTAAAFAATIDFPTAADTLEAVLLQGQKSLMNDQPLMPFIQQLAGASLRSFQSLPNGAFFGFFPDYFGSYFHRQPYWEIDKIEILDGRIDLTDDNLVTHMYVVGDRFPLPNQDENQNLINEIMSGGVVTVFNAFAQGDWLVDGTSALIDQSTMNAKQTGPIQGHKTVTSYGPNFRTLHDTQTAIEFLQKFGARPLKMEEPFIRSPFFEAFMAFQQFQLAWSRQFLTTFQFTFMPELYPGGRVYFKDYGFACYIDQVEHNWDYETGFTTDVNLSAPSAIVGPGGAGANPITRGMIEAAPINTTSTGSSSTSAHHSRSSTSSKANQKINTK